MPALVNAAEAVSARVGSSLSRSIAFLLDIDGTLVHTDHLYRKVFNACSRRSATTSTTTTTLPMCTARWTRRSSESFCRLGRTRRRLRLSKKGRLFCRALLGADPGGRAAVLKGLREALTMAQQLGVRCIAVTNAQRGAGEATIASLREHIPAASIIEGLVIGAECENAKPAPDPYIEGMRQLGVRPSDCVVFEDSRSGVRSGVAANVMSVVGLRTSLTDVQLREAGCDATLGDWSEMDADFLGRLIAPLEREPSPEASA